MKKMKENKGFTLVELIVVIVILAILAAILVPALLGYIDKAKGQQIVLNGKSVMTAAQTELSSAYAKGKKPSSIDKAEILKVADVAGTCEEFEIKVGGAADADATSDNHAAFTVTGVKYTENGKTIYFVKSGSSASWDATEGEYNASTTGNIATTYTKTNSNSGSNGSGN